MTHLDSQPPASGKDDAGILVYIAAWSGLALALTLAARFVYLEWNDRGMYDLMLRHFPAIIGIPVAAFAAFVLVALFRTSDGTIKVTVSKLAFEGASGPIIMWAICFLVIVLGVSLLWK